MSNQSTEFFLKKDPYFNSNTVYGYFDFNQSGASGSSVFSGANWSSKSTSLVINSPSNFWQYSGLGFLNEQNFCRIKNLDAQSAAFILTYEMESFSGQNNIFISSFGKSNENYSGVNFGISPFGFPYIEYYDNIYGPITVCHNSKAPKTGIFYCEISPINYAVGTYNPVNKSINKSIAQFSNINATYSNNYILGSGSNFENSKNSLNAKISDIFIYDLSVFNNRFYEESFVSGTAIDLTDQVITGVISGTTGIIESEIVELTECYIQKQTTGVFVPIIENATYFASFQEFLDFNTEKYNKFSQLESGNITGSGFSLQSIDVNVCKTVTGINTYQYESGYVIQYKIVNKIASNINYKYLTDYINYIFLNSDIDNSDKLFIIGANNYNDNIGFSKFIFENNINRFDTNFTNTNALSGYYYNGQLQIKDQTYSTIISGGDIYYYPSKDYFSSGKYIYTNNPSFELSSSYILIDSWPDQAYVITGNIASGSVINGISLNNKLCFLNGQLLTSGIDYQNNQILINIPSGYNIISTQDLANKDFKIKTIINSSGRLFNVNSIARQTSSVWLNGIRLMNNNDYIELEEDIYSSDLLYIKNQGNILFQI
jgi:hypothetical protein